MSRSNIDKPFYVDVGTSIAAVRCQSNRDVLDRFDHVRLGKAGIEMAEKECDRMNAEVDKFMAAKDEEVVSLRSLVKELAVALEKIDDMYNSYMCKFFTGTKHCSKCKYLEKCQTGIAHNALKDNEREIAKAREACK